MPLVAGVLFLAIGGFSIWQNQSWTVEVLPHMYRISIPVPPGWEVNCCGDTDMNTRHIVFNPKTTTRDAAGNTIYDESIKITQQGPMPDTDPAVEFSPTVSQEIRSGFAKRFAPQN